MTMSNRAGHRDRLRQAFLNGEDKAQTDAALLELLLFQVVPIQDVAPRVKELLDAHGTLHGVLQAEGEWPAKLRAAANLLRRLAGRLTDLAPRPPRLKGDGEEEGAVNRSLEDEEERAAISLQLSLLPDAGERHVSGPAVELDPDDRAAVGGKEWSDTEPDEVREPGADGPGMRAKTRQGIAGKILIQEAIRLLPEIAAMSREAEVRAYLRGNLRFNSVETRQRNANYLFSQVFIHGFPDPALQTFARCFAGTPELQDVCYHRLCRAEALLVDITEDLLASALASGTLERAVLRRYLQSRFPGSRSIDDYMRAIVVALTNGGVARATPDALRLRHRELRPAAFAFVVHSKFPEPGMHRIEALLESRTLRAMLWRTDQLLPALYDLRNRGWLAKISEIDRFRQFTTQWTPVELVAHLSQGGSTP